MRSCSFAASRSQQRPERAGARDEPRSGAGTPRISISRARGSFRRARPRAATVTRIGMSPSSTFSGSSPARAGAQVTHSGRSRTRRTGSCQQRARVVCRDRVERSRRRWSRQRRPRSAGRRARASSRRGRAVPALLASDEHELATALAEREEQRQQAGADEQPWRDPNVHGDRSGGGPKDEQPRDRRARRRARRA